MTEQLWRSDAGPRSRDLGARRSCKLGPFPMALVVADTALLCAGAALAQPAKELTPAEMAEGCPRNRGGRVSESDRGNKQARKFLGKPTLQICREVSEKALPRWADHRDGAVRDGAIALGPTDRCEGHASDALSRG
jgi:hypothetical protein